MKVRIISALILIPLLYAVYSGGWILKIAGFIIGLMALKEFYNAFKGLEIKPSFMIGTVSSIILYLFIFFNRLNHLWSLWIFITILLILLTILIKKDSWVKEGAVTALGILYVVFFSFHVILIDGIEKYNIMIWLVFITAFVTDTCAYFSGYLFGKHKLWPEISPKKTIEGAVGGTIGSIVVSALFGYFMASDLMIHYIIIGFIGSIAGQTGDLTASAFKRRLGIKDFGTMIPGHGGILDRFDSILLTAPIIYYYIILFIQ